LSQATTHFLSLEQQIYKTRARSINLKGHLGIVAAVYLFLGWTPLSIGIIAGIVVHIGVDRVKDCLF
jgi:hypothetical protein